MNYVSQFKIITDVIAGKRHANYEKTVANARKLKAYVTGNETVYEYCRQFDLRETWDSYKAKKDLIKPATSELVNKIQSTYLRVFRANHQFDIVGAKSKDVDSVLKQFHKGKKTPLQFIKSQFGKLTMAEPNGFVVIEHDGTNGKEFVRPYPFVVPCESALDFKKSMRDELQYLIVRTKSDIVGCSKFTGYFCGFSIVFDPIAQLDTDFSAEMQVLQLSKSGTKETFAVIFQSVKYLASIHFSPVSVVLAMQIGYIESDFGYQSVLDLADASISNFIRRDTESKIADMKTANPVLLQYKLETASVEKGKAKENKISPDESKIEGIEIPLDSRKIINSITADNLPDLEKFFKHANPDITVNRYLSESADKAEAKVLKAIFGHDYMSNPDKVKTAYESLSNDNSVHAALMPFDTHCLDAWQWICEAVIKLMGLENDVKVSYIQDLDYSLTTLGELLSILAELKKTDAPQYLQVAILLKVIDRLFVGESDTIAYLKKCIQLDGFAGLNAAQISGRLASPLISEIEKKRHLGLRKALYLLSIENPNFLGFEDRKVIELVDSKINETVGTTTLSV